MTKKEKQILIDRVAWAKRVYYGYPLEQRGTAAYEKSLTMYTALGRLYEDLTGQPYEEIK